MQKRNQTNLAKWYHNMLLHACRETGMDRSGSDGKQQCLPTAAKGRAYLGWGRPASSPGRLSEGSAVAGDGGYSAPGSHTFEDRPWLEGENMTEGTENPTDHNEPARASSSVGANDVPPSYPVRGVNSYMGSCKHPRGPCNGALSIWTNTLKA
ncbi:hypothetical protein K438DRAFT_1750656 [Mycena galopus ATCC 62051]|nr:hypothetical protein K438DRAFT_1750656 [Mycena galopus ATCC 62051]